MGSWLVFSRELLRAITHTGIPNTSTCIELDVPRFSPPGHPGAGRAPAVVAGLFKFIKITCSRCFVYISSAVSIARFLRLVLHAVCWAQARVHLFLVTWSPLLLRCVSYRLPSNSPSTYPLSRIPNALRRPNPGASTVCIPFHSSPVFV